MNAVFFHAGQICSAGTRLLIEDRIHDQFVDALVERVNNIKLGSGFDETTQMGPLISAEHLNKVTTYVEDGVAEGAVVATGGARPTDPRSEERRVGKWRR